jgi:hypothetical protein
MAVLGVGEGPGRKIVPAGASGGLRIGRNHLDALFEEIVPVLDPLGIALTDQEDDGRGIGR